MPQDVGRMTRPSRHEVATLAGGCFWCLEAVFDELEGVEDVVSGYTGGTVPDPTYQQVCSGETGHAEAVQVTFNPDVISYRDLLKVFFAIHDPTTLNRQGVDIGTQYRSAIFTHPAGGERASSMPVAPHDSISHTETQDTKYTDHSGVSSTAGSSQERIAHEVIAELTAARLWDAPIVTEVVPAGAFYSAEEYHQEYFRRNPNQGYCRIVIAPKVAKFRKQYLERLKKKVGEQVR